jgi:hypothetical protein
LSQTNTSFCAAVLPPVLVPDLPACSMQCVELEYHDPAQGFVAPDVTLCCCRCIWGSCHAQLAAAGCSSCSIWELAWHACSAC